MGARSLRSPVGHGGRIGEPPSGGADHRGRRAFPARGEAGNIDYPYRVRNRRRSGRTRRGREFQSSGGNATGVTLLTTLMEPKRLGLLRDLVPGVPLVGVLLNPAFAPALHYSQAAEEAARSIDQRILIANASTDEELETAFAAFISAHVGALLVTADPYFDTRREQIVAFAARQRLPSIYQFREYAVAGGLLSY